MEIIKQENYRGYQINIERDPFAADPRKDFDNLGTLFFFDRDKNHWGDQNTGYRDLNHFIELEMERATGLCRSGHELHYYPDLWALTEKFNEHLILMPVAVSYHGHGVDLWVGFDTGWSQNAWVGFVFVEKEAIRKEYGWKLITKARRERIEAHLKAEVQTYAEYLSGEVYGFSFAAVGDPDDPLDSCWGFYGTDYVLEAAKESVDQHIEHARKQYLKRVREWVKNRVPLEKRNAEAALLEFGKQMKWKVSA